MTRSPERRARRALAVLAVAALLACFGGSAAPTASAPPVSDEEAALFAVRAEQFYRQLAGVSLPALLTYDNPAMRGYFSKPAAYADYYSALATLARQKTLRDGMARVVTIREFHFDGPDQAVVEVLLTGKHERGLRFWDIDLDRRDIWRRIDGVWVIVPEKL